MKRQKLMGDVGLLSSGLSFWMLQGFIYKLWGGKIEVEKKNNYFLISEYESKMLG